jgi:hypothetical protein
MMEEAFALARRLCWLAPGSAKDEHLRNLLLERYATPLYGRWTVARGVRSAALITSAGR